MSKIANNRSAAQLALSLEPEANLQLWRPIHYLGSKLRLVTTIRELLDDLDPTGGTVCDLFAGSGTVSIALSNNRSVIASDIQEYSRVLCAALLQPTLISDSTVDRLLQTSEQYVHQFEACLEPILEFEKLAIESALQDPSLLCDLVERGSLLGTNGDRDKLGIALKRTRAGIQTHKNELTATRYFGGVYFSYRQTLYIDCVLAAIDSLSPDYRDTCIAAILSTASSVVNTVGKQFAQPLRPRRSDGTIKQHLIRQMCRDRCQSVAEEYSIWLSKYRKLTRNGSHHVIRGDYREVLSQVHNVSVVYADPPYTRDHYSRFYHVLETLCLRDAPEVSETRLYGESTPSRGVYRKDRHQSPFCIKSQAPNAFAELFAGTRKLGAPLLLSYSPFVKDGHPRLMTIEAVAKLAKEYYRRVKIVSGQCVTHSKLNKSELHLHASGDAEVFLVCVA